MFYLREASADALYHRLLDTLVEAGTRYAPRGQPTREVIGLHLMLLDPRRCLVTSNARRLNYYFAVAEWWWIASGREDVQFIHRFNKQLLQFSDDGKVFAGAYGPRWRAQLYECLRALEADPATRQSVVSLWQPHLLNSGTKDTPCTLSFQYLNRGGLLECVATMRSSDAWLGFPYDLHNFARLQAMVAGALGLGLGPLHLTLGSSHLYERDLEGALRVREEYAANRAIGYAEEVALPLLPGVPEIHAMGKILDDDEVRHHFLTREWDHVSEVLRGRYEPTAMTIENPYRALALRPRVEP